MYRLIKDFLKTILYCSPLGLIIIPLWSLIEILLNVFIKIFIVFPLYLLDLLLEYTKNIFEKLFSNYANPQDNIIKCKLLVSIIIIIFSLFWFYCSYAVYNNLSFVNSRIIQSFSVQYWWLFILIALGYIVFSSISIYKELGFWAIALTIFNIICFIDKTCFNIFATVTITFLIFGCFYFINKIRGLEFHSEIMKDIEADTTLNYVEKWNYYRRKTKW